MPYLLDTDSASLAFEGNEGVRSRIRQASGVWLSSIAAEERVRGALNLIQKNRDKPSLPAAHDFLTRLLSTSLTIVFTLTPKMLLVFSRRFLHK